MKNPDSFKILAAEAITQAHTQWKNSNHPRDYALIDVRSEGEYLSGSIPGFLNFPILNDVERHQVGTTYKQVGQPAAIELGHQLVGPHRSDRINSWLEQISRCEQSEAIVACWRGGMRSGIAAQWIREAGGRARTVQGGYKAIRGELLNRLSSPPPLRILAGLTGSGKTRILKRLPTSVLRLDLEGLAAHRGSSFGAQLKIPQPNQTDFENRLALAFWEHPQGTYFAEDESVTIGALHIPPQLRAQMLIAPIVLVKVTLEERAKNIYEEYIEDPIQGGYPRDLIREQMLNATLRLQKKLGGAATQDVAGKIELAFARGERDSHLEWIQILLVKYYDPLYQFGFNRKAKDRPVLFEGDPELCLKWMSNSPKP